MNRFWKYMLVVLLAFLPGCVAEDLYEQTQMYEAADVHVELSTKAVADADLSESKSIKDIWLFQFGGTSDAAKLLGSPVYIDYSSDPVDGTDNTRYVSLITSSSEVSTVVAVANTHDPQKMWSVATLGLMKQAAASVSASDDNWNQETKDLVMSGFAQDVVKADGQLKIDFQINVAKVVFDLTNTSASGMTLRTVSLCNAASQSRYAQSLVPVGGLQTEYVDYAEEPAVSGSRYYWYVPRNDMGNTKVRVFATNAEGVAYHYELPVDRNGVKAGHVYNMSLTLEEPGNPDMDETVIIYGEQRLDNANCFIVCPYPEGGLIEGVTTQRRFSFPITQVNRYWDEVKHDASRKITPSTQWTAEVLWQDVDGLVSLVTTSGKGLNQRVVFSVKNGTYGNAVIALKVNGAILWSWHIWATDYNPDQEVVKQDKKYSYNVPGGYLHRYAGSFWEPSANGYDAYVATYRDKFIMDRGLGAMVTGGCGLFYQWGRKDPFTKTPTDIINDKISMELSVLSPMKYANGDHNWCTVGFSFNQWNSPYPTEEKSIFDPCPAGWKVPDQYVWDNFKNGETINSSSRGLGWTVGGVNGLRYWPLGIVMQEPVLYMPGFLVNGVFNNVYVRVWSCASVDGWAGYSISGASTGYTQFKQSDRKDGHQVRCVKE